MAFMFVFAVQIFASSLCISTTAQAAEASSLEHCHQNIEHAAMQHEMGSMPMQAGSEQLPMSACSHCSAPDDFTVISSAPDQIPVTFLVIYLATTLMTPTFGATTPLFIEKAQAPPNSSSTLYITTQRIRI
jgi:hypothetical protein